MITSRISSGVTPLRIAALQVHRQLDSRPRALVSSAIVRHERVRRSSPAAPTTFPHSDVGQVVLERPRVLRPRCPACGRVLVAEHLTRVRSPSSISPPGP
jgi:hypothetical protein